MRTSNRHAPRRHPDHRAVGALLAGALCVAPVSASGLPVEPPPRGTPRTLIDRRLQEHAVQLIALDTATITYTDSAGLLRKESRDEFLAVLPQAQDLGAAAATALRPPSVAELVDGQRYAGRAGAVPSRSSPGESIAWEHAALGTLDLKLDDLRRLQLRPQTTEPSVRPAPPTSAAGADTDIVVLTNGDRAEGLTEGFLADGPALRLSAGGSSRDIPFERIQEVRILSNPGAALPERSAVLWLRDGSVIACRSIRTDRTGDVSLEVALREPPGGGEGDRTTLAASAAVPLGEVLGADLHPGTLVPLASIPAENQRPTGNRRWTRPVVASSEALLRLGDVELPGPMSAEWELPAGAERFSADAQLPRAAWDWGDAELIVTLITPAGETELFRRRLSADQPGAAVNAPLGKPAAGARLGIRLESGAYGAVQDRVILHRPVLLIDDK
jgi:hypothetical protein